MFSWTNKTRFPRLTLFVLAALAITLASVAVWAACPKSAKLAGTELNFLTEEYPPFGYMENNVIKGISVDLMTKMLGQTDKGMKAFPLQLTSWTEAYKTVQDCNNSALLMMTRTPARETMFKWVGPIAPTRISLIARKDKNLQIKDFAGVKKLKVGALKDDVGEQLLLKGGVKSSEITIRQSSEEIIQLLASGKIDAWAYEETAGLWLIKRATGSNEAFGPAYTLFAGELYFAFNKNVPDKSIKKLQNALNTLKKEKTAGGATVYENIIKKY